MIGWGERTLYSQVGNKVTKRAGREAPLADTPVSGPTKRWHSGLPAHWGAIGGGCTVTLTYGLSFG